MTARPIPTRHWRSYGTEPLPTGGEALAEPFRAFPSWFMRITCDRCGKDRMLNEAHEAERRADPRYHRADASRRLRRQGRAGQGRAGEGRCCTRRRLEGCGLLAGDPLPAVAHTEAHRGVWLHSCHDRPARCQRDERRGDPGSPRSPGRKRRLPRRARARCTEAREIADSSFLSPIAFATDPSQRKRLIGQRSGGRTRCYGKSGHGFRVRSGGRLAPVPHAVSNCAWVRSMASRRSALLRLTSLRLASLRLAPLR